MSIDVIPVESAGAVAAERTGPSPRGELLHDIVRSKTFIVGAVIVGFWIICAIFGYAIAPHNPTAENLEAINKAPSSAHWFGTDQLGRDVFSRVITGARNILIIVPLAVILSTVLGTALGLVMGYFRGLLDESIARVLEAFLALPLIVIALTAIAAIGASNLVVILVIAVVFTPLIARTVRTSVLLERELDYVAAARLRGEKSPYIMFVEILPNVMAPIVVEFTVRIGYAVFAVAALSFLGFGVQPPTPDWAADIAANYPLVAAGYWWEVLFAALALASLVIGINLIADAVEGAIDQ
ncbi:MAG TPA: ABC transporter permease [Solirubrobacteraceae bacterium]|nr:ABC transporter permease [Solirubrobacteraceae bacterium]